MEDAAPQRGLRAARVVLNRAGQELVEAVEAGRTVDEVGDRCGLLGVDPWSDVDQDEGAHELGCLGGQSDGGHAAERHPDHAEGVGGQLAHHRRQVATVASGRHHALGPPVGVAVPGQVHGEQRTAEHEGDGVPGVGVLSPAVHQHELRRPGSAPQNRLETRRPGSTSTSTRLTSGGPA